MKIKNKKYVNLIKIKPKIIKENQMKELLGDSEKCLRSSRVIQQQKNV